MTVRFYEMPRRQMDATLVGDVPQHPEWFVSDYQAGDVRRVWLTRYKDHLYIILRDLSMRGQLNFIAIDREDMRLDQLTGVENLINNLSPEEANRALEDLIPFLVERVVLGS